MIDDGLLERARAKGTDRQYCDWLKTQPSALGTGYDYDWDIGSFCVPAHFRTAQNSGTSTKPDFHAIPLRNAEHQRQHAIGTFAFMPREWWEKQVCRHLESWIASR